MPKPKTEATAWRELAEWLSENPARQFICNLLADNAVGVTYSPVNRFPDNHGWPLRTMQERMNIHMELVWSDEERDSTLVGSRTLDAVNFPTPEPLPNTIRVLFCELMALESESESEA